MTNSAKEVQISMEVILEILEKNLSSDEDGKKKAELKIKELRSKVPDEFGIHLSKCVIGNKSSTSVRKLASNILRQYVTDLWTRKIGLETKKTIRELLLSGFCEADSEIRDVADDAIRNIAWLDWPNSLPNLFETLVETLQSKNEFAVLGSMGVIQLSSSRLTISQLTDIGPVIFREMYRIFENAEIFSAQARSKALEIFSQIVCKTVMSGMRKRTDPVDQALEPSIKLFCSKFLEILGERTGMEIETNVKSEIIDAIANLTWCFPESISTFLPAMLPLIWETLTECGKVYRERIINASGGIENNGVWAYEGVPAHFKGLVSNILRLIRFLMSFYEPNLKDSLPEAEYLKVQNSWQPEILEHLFTLIEINEEQIESWTQDPKQYMDDESLAMMSNGTLRFHTIRYEARGELVGILKQKVDGAGPEMADTVNATCYLIQKRIVAGNEMRSSTDSGVKRNWWKLHEASIQVFGEMANVFTNQGITQNSKFDVQDFLKNVVLVHLNDPEVHPLLIGSCLHVSRSYIELMSLDLRLEFLKSTINCLKNRPNCTRVRAARVARYWIHFVLDQENNDENKDILKEQLPTLLEAISDLGSQLMSAEVLTVVLENFYELASRGEEFTAFVEGSVCTLAIAVFLEYRSDEYIIALCLTVFSKLTQNPACSGSLQARLVPILIARLAANPKKVSADVSVDLETLQMLVEQSPQPLSSILIENAFPAVCRFILTSEEHTEYCLDRACTVLHSYLSHRGAQRVIDYRDNDGRTGLQYILQIVDHLFDLAKKFRNFGNLYEACKILENLTATGNILGKNLEQLLKAMLGFAQNAESIPVFDEDDDRFYMKYVEDLGLALSDVWAQLFETEFDSVLEFLSTAQAPDGQSALAFVISHVIRDALHSFDFEHRCRKVFRPALCKIVDYGISNLDSKLHEIEFHETKNGAKKAVPILVKVSELVTYELQRLHRAARDKKNHTGRGFLLKSDIKQ